ncbi:MAG: nitroreductase family deazaflavin-dependent oxidoreductase [Candidatus Nephthysia bennettiae]|uniref:Nitroreductase family deazaflavin-dependent oxidoreductase n=1 Tax=Candidatus Nephthysia bennettiae TaxID=3127016 RepID=A0A934JZD8_9BACT|nr:nitroreductase family deazaflavin-dependent oxidoreductase [Candidatus Dormibacteraeota bacterium]MBJ7613120.1 nitroreductase family deazaflavin-dependent oxidoreductase [Candidatus Dormibacteraeota bacterium]PZR86885.1 MAG: nitroreductase family deazaflavin-dependent oxidoreductase [Candidatus Dormibacteraeota bacterium]
MPLPKSLARFNLRVTNRVTGPLAGRLPWFGVLVHRGRRSGRTYRTPVNVFEIPDWYVVALTYGPDAEWVRNVLEAGECELQTRGRRVRLTAPRLVRDENRRLVPPPVRPILRALGVAHFLVLRPA